ncbi:hypothetical protein BV22DRAFT_1051765 [Leucogyrophana mollusca]|uniref:Uncharacterized protein n=1 Tax=Leucogyrophana mollusca TaxID=85980 RepID=A0ACB8AYC0_9AGAM|nr:hypothetical protein BV22DRAFT_1051765 [Leucogyrophana mollusca]
MLSKWTGSAAEVTCLDDNDNWVPPEVVRIQHEWIFLPPEGQSSVPRRLQAVAATQPVTLLLPHLSYAPVLRQHLPPASTQQGTAFAVAKPTVPVTVEASTELESARMEHAPMYTPKLIGFDDGDGMDVDRLASSCNADDAAEEPDNSSGIQGIKGTHAAATTVSLADKSREEEVGEHLVETVVQIGRVEDGRTWKEGSRGRTLARTHCYPSPNNGKRARREDSASVVRRPRGHDVWQPGPAGSQNWSLSPPNRAKVISRPPSQGKLLGEKQCYMAGCRVVLTTTSQLHSGLSKSKGKPMHLQIMHTVMSKKDLEEACTEYLSKVMTLLLQPHARWLLTMGGLLWRIALEYGPPTLYQAALAGPSIDTTLYNLGEYLPDSGETDNIMSETEIEVL